MSAQTERQAAFPGLFDRLVIGTDGISNASNIAGLGLLVWGVRSEAHPGLAGASLAPLLLLIAAVGAWLAWIAFPCHWLPAWRVCLPRGHGGRRGSPCVVRPHGCRFRRRGRARRGRRVGNAHGGVGSRRQLGFFICDRYGPGTPGERHDRRSGGIFGGPCDGRRPAPVPGAVEASGSPGA